ncbi:ATP-binding protein [Sporosarcina soli]|uniref:histidine kinase n=1 Tax=Sporosarcina soli TaxID=334736 RepID=A0ABW0TR12_9BACL
MSKSKINQTKYILVLVVIFGILTSLRLLWAVYHAPAEQPLAQNGLMDLRGYDLTEDQTIVLDGEWSFYPDKLVDPGEIDKTIGNPSQNAKDASHQFGTYHLTILVDEHSVADEVYSIRIPSTSTASALFINGHLKGESGVVATDIDRHQGKGNPYVVSFFAKKNKIDIVLHVSNFDTSQGIAINKSIKFGTHDAIAKEQHFTDILMAGIVITLLLYSIYSLLIYLFIHRANILLFFAFGFLLPGIDELITYNSASMGWLPLNYEWSFKFKELVYLGAALFLIQIMEVLLPNFQQYKRFWWFNLFYGLCAIAIIVFPLNTLIQVNVAFFILYIISFLSVVSLALKEYFQYKDESFFIAIVVTSTTSGIVWGLIKVVSGMEIPFYPFDYLFAFLGFAFFWFRRFYRQNRRVVELVDELKRADLLKDEFLTSSAKKLWNPLNKMTTIAQTLQNQDSLTPKEKNNLEHLINIGRSMSFTLNDLLDFTRLNENMIQVHPKSINIHAVIFGVFDLLHYLADGKQIKLTSTVPTDFPHVVADESRLIQIFFNLLENAIKYTECGNVRVHAKVLNDLAIICIEDTGIGMDEKTQENVMSAYGRGIEDDEGLGLGLNVSKKLIELHGGSLQIQSELRKGTKFIFTLPLAPGQNGIDGEINRQHHDISTEKKDSDEEQQCSTNKNHILVVDDDPSNLKVIAEIFPPEQYQVITETRGTEALKLLHVVEWDLIIIDVMMPYMSGYELTKLIRARYSLTELPILLLTSRNDTADVNIGLSSGANDYVAKPINWLELKSRSIALIDLKKSISEKQYMESAWLQAQIRPHFLFNTLNTIASLSTLDTDRMVNLLSEFGNYLHSSFKEDNLNRVIPLEEELELVKSYLYIESERFGDRLQVKWEIDENIIVEVPPLSIQTLVENAVLHGVLKKGSTGTVCIQITRQEEFTKVAILDDGVGMNREQVSRILDDENRAGTGIGLLNTDKRLKRIFGKGLKIQSSPSWGTTVEFRIPHEGTSS